MKHLFTITTMLVWLVCCGDGLPNQFGTAQTVKIPKLNSVSEVIAFLRMHPAIKTTGIPLGEIAVELGIDHSLLGRYINDDSHLETKKLQVNRKARSFIFAKDAMPHQQLADYLNSLDQDMFKTGVSFEQVENNVQYRQDGWSSDDMRRSLGHNIDKEKYAVYRLVTKKSEEKYIFLKGYEPPKQIAVYLANLDQETLEKGVPIAQIADNVTYLPDDWSVSIRHQSIGNYINRDKYIVHSIVSEGKREKRVFLKDISPTMQITNYLKSLAPEALAQGVHVIQIADNVNYTHNLARKASNISIRTHLDQENYFIRGRNIKNKNQLFVFPRHTLAYIKAISPDDLKAGVLIDKVKNLPTDEELDKVGYATVLLSRDLEYEKFIFAKKYLPRRQISRYLASLAPEQLKQGVSVAQVADNIVRYGYKDWSREDFHGSIVLHLDKDKYRSDFLLVNSKVETYIFAKGFTSHEQILNYLQSIDPKIFKRKGISLQQVADNVSYRQPEQSDFEFFTELSWFIDGRHGYVLRYRKTDNGGKELRISLKQ